MNLKSFYFLILLSFPGIIAGCNYGGKGGGSAPAVQEPYSQNPGQSQQSLSPASVSSGTISGTITLDPKLAGKVDPNAVLFISAKPAEGTQVGVIPLASKRVANVKFPLEYTLSAQDIIMPGATLTGKLNIVAKLMKNGAAGPVGPGDIEGHFAKNPVEVGQKSVDITLDTLH